MTKKTTTIGAMVSQNYQTHYKCHMTNTIDASSWQKALIFRFSCLKPVRPICRVLFIFLTSDPAVQPHFHRRWPSKMVLFLHNVGAAPLRRRPTHLRRCHTRLIRLQWTPPPWRPAPSIEADGALQWAYTDEIHAAPSRHGRAKDDRAAVDLAVGGAWQGRGRLCGGRSGRALMVWVTRSQGYT
jgi:hypothetical protein